MSWSTRRFSLDKETMMSELAFEKRAQAVFDSGNVEAINELRRELCCRKAEAAEATYESKAERFRVLQMFDSWLARLNHRKSLLNKESHIEQVEAAIRGLRKQVRDMLPHLRYEGPDPVAWGRFCADINESSTSRKKERQRDARRVTYQAGPPRKPVNIP